jgi:hypothetical protein
MLGKGYLCAVVTQDAANWPTPDASNHRDGEVLRKDNNLEQGGFHGVSLHHAMTKYGQAAPASSSSLGSRQGLSESSQRNWQTFAHGTHNRGETPHRQVVKALVLGEKAKTQCLTVDQVFAEEIKGTNVWPTITAHTPDMESSGPNGNSGTYLAGAVKSWLTPKVPSGGSQTERTTAGGGLRKLEDQTQTQSGKLNPRWVETLMGLPVGWVMPSCASPVTIEPTNYDSSATESCLQPQSELSELFGRNSND